MGGFFMKRDAAVEFIRGQLGQYLKNRGISTSDSFPCLNPLHAEKEIQSMRFNEKRNRVHCFGCGVDYDIFDVIRVLEDISDREAVFRRACELFDVVVDEDERPVPEAWPLYEGLRERREAMVRRRGAVDYTEYFKACAKRIGETSYLHQRGLSDEIIQWAGLGYDPNYTRGTGGKVWKAVIIPKNKSGFIARNTDTASNERYRKTGPNSIYNAIAIKNAQQPVFVVEGELDALSIMEVGGDAVALGTTSNINKFIELLKTCRPKHPLLIAMDNDSQGRSASRELQIALKQMNIPFYCVNLTGPYKDASEALVEARDGFRTIVVENESIEEPAREVDKEGYLQNSMLNHIPSFIRAINTSVHASIIPTGFAKLDAVLDGGLYEGLYIISAAGSLGKTTFVLQMADQIAAGKGEHAEKGGSDVIFFSLETGRSALMAKSISRITFEKAMQQSAEAKLAKTARAISTGRRYTSYDQEEIDLINAAIETYKTYAGHVYISEGLGDIGVEDIRKMVDKHIRFTGRRPVVIVDYIHRLSPYDERMNDRQNTNKAVLELKRISRDFKVPVVAVSGVDSVDGGTYAYASPGEMKELGAIEHSSDVLISMQLAGETYNDIESAHPIRSIELAILKNRYGKSGDTLSYRYHTMYNCFEE